MKLLAPLVAGFLLIVAAEPLAAQSGDAVEWRFRLEPQFFASPAAEIEARQELRDLADQLTQASLSLTRAADLLAALALEDRMQRAFRRHDLYHFLRFAIDTEQTGGLAVADELRQARTAASAALAASIADRPDGWVERALASESALERYRYRLQTIRSEASTRLAPGTEAALAAFAPLHSARDYTPTVQDLVFPAVRVDGKVIDFAPNRGQLESHSDPAVRLAGERALLAGYASQRALFAHLLMDSISGANAAARLRGHSDALDKAASEAHVTVEHYRGLLGAVASQAGVFKKWQARTADPFTSERRWSAAEAVAAITASAAALGPTYRGAFAALLDPANGRADLKGPGNRLPIRGTASVYPIGTSAIYLQEYKGSLLDLIVMAHEGGHAVQADLMFDNQVPMMQSAGPGYFTESFGRFQELLLLDYLFRTASSGPDRNLFRDALAARLLSVFNSAEEAAIELAIHDAASEPAPPTADLLDAVTLKAGERYSNAYRELPERRGVWMMSEGYFMAPLQELNDAYASLLAMRYYQAWRANPEQFAASYRALLSRGYNAPPAEMIKDALGLDLLSVDFAPTTLAALDAEIARLYPEGEFTRRD